MEPGALVDLVGRAAPHGLDSVQLRLRGLPAREVLAVGEALIRVLRPLRIPLLVNDRLDLALAMDSHGVHLRADGLSPHVAVELWERLHPGNPPILGRSVHSVGEAVEATDVTYLIFGHVFETASKQGLPGRGLPSLAHVARSAGAPVLAIGGITPDRVAQVIGAGAAGVAVRSYLTKAPDPARATEALRRALDAAWHESGSP
ncbi:thiamine-phosphate pyrophosphorylase [Limnochorda pilosa]|uniref:Thiamine-phosphate pyrophosphorylase n=2 Tax=Limnochorda pilosa TaxID=1555112 RepID=A0A0K2SGB1_LIMPI|nr:thiamine-phosphate pyrophosphorylase [Limnochorda pilosa]